MKVDEIIKLANEIIADDNDHRTPRGSPWFDDTRAKRLVADAPRLARAISSLLTAETCGWERPGVAGGAYCVPDGKILVPNTWATYVSPADARVMAVMLLRSADESENTNG